MGLDTGLELPSLSRRWAENSLSPSSRLQTDRWSNASWPLLHTLKHACILKSIGTSGASQRAETERALGSWVFLSHSGYTKPWAQEDEDTITLSPRLPCIEVISIFPRERCPYVWLTHWNLQLLLLVSVHQSLSLSISPCEKMQTAGNN